MNQKFKYVSVYMLIIFLSTLIGVEMAIADCKTYTKNASYYQLKKEWNGNDFYVWFSIPTNATSVEVKGKTSAAKSTLKKAQIDHNRNGIGKGTVRVIAGLRARLFNYGGSQNDLKRFANDIYVKYKVCK